MKSGGAVLVEKGQDKLENPGEAPSLATKKKRHMVALSLVTYEPIGNPLEKMQPAKRKAFLDSVFRAARPVQQRQPIAVASAALEQFRRQSSQQAALAEAEKAKAASRQWLVSGKAPAESLQRQADAAQESSRKNTGEKLAVAAGKSAGEAQKILFGESADERLKASQKSALGAGGWQASGTMSSLLPKFSSSGGAFGDVRDSLAFALADFSRGDDEKLRAAVGEFDARLSSQQYKAPDLMAILLLVIEDLAWGEGGSEGAAGSASHFGARIGGRKGPVAPEILRQSAKDSSIVRLASVREMLRYYFERYPKEYASMLAAALGITADQESDPIHMQERLASELVHIGGFALAQKILVELKRKKKLEKDTNKCLLELGYRYDRKRKVLVLGKRTCGSPEDTQGLVALLSANLKK